MAKIETYTTVTPTINDKVIGTDVSDNNETKNFLISDLLGLSTEVTTILETTVNLSVAQIGDLHNTAVTLIDAPGAGSFINIEKVYSWMDYVSTPWVTGADFVSLQLGGGALSFSSNIFEQTDGTTVVFFPLTQGQNTILSNTALTLNSSGAITGGDSAAKIYIKYSIVTLT